jgi:hypothetical protein
MLSPRRASNRLANMPTNSSELRIWLNPIKPAPLALRGASAGCDGTGKCARESGPGIAARTTPASAHGIPCGEPAPPLTLTG